ncbi:uncharacterized protein LOC120279472 [Dioscorea cayenensis subsp. rotundata]|uniref:Uncharacterized protein LOC120279472 n=1 Tax=Dioscorea cayennensis subsp. rotundata TaxID=55577 RepID=A0AB40CQH7_DIOCR|nr:uncharacterized protein LOC120279472 [Dioscorea cayenensis subsp. rotundata]
MASISFCSASPSLPLFSSASIRPRRSVMIVASATASSSGDGKWWAPLFRSIMADPGDGAKGVEGESEGKKGRGRLTAEKAKELRRQLRESESWHDGMYHSAIASRLASPDQHH